MNNFLALNEKTRGEMLESIGKSNVEELFSQIPQKARMQNFDLPQALNEMQAQRVVKNLAKKNNSDYIYFIGAGTYNKFIPAAVSQIAQRYEFLTAYTPYQPEIAQGSLQVMYEFQSLICRLTGMDISNASVYDGATATAEAVLMAKRVSKKNKALISDKINPEYLKTVQTYAWANEIELKMFDVVPENISDYACVVIQNPDFYGEIHDIKKPEGGLLILITDVSSLALLKPPAQYGADIVVHSATKYLSGHNDLLGGILVCKDQQLAQQYFEYYITTGDTLDSFDSWLLLRSLKTLNIRVKQHTKNAQEVVKYLKQDPRIEQVLYPGKGGMISFYLKNEADVAKLLDNVKLITFAESLGGIESLITIPYYQTHADVELDQRQRLGITPRLLRLSVGLEDPADVIADIQQALG